MSHGDSLATLDAAVHYMHMGRYWVQMHELPIIYRYVDWSNTVPLQLDHLWVCGRVVVCSRCLRLEYQSTHEQTDR